MVHSLAITIPTGTLARGDMMMTLEQTLYIVRHGQSIANASRVMQGWWNSSLSLAGQQEVARLKPFLPANVPIIASDLDRARQTAEILQADAQATILDRRLREVNVGDWQGRAKAELIYEREWQDFMTSPEHFQFPRGEALTAVVQRLRTVMDEITDAAAVLITHRLALRCLLSDLTQNWNGLHHIAIPNASITLIQRSCGKSWDIKTVGWVP